MALNLQTFKTRALTAVVFVVVMLFGLFFSKVAFIALFSVVFAGCVNEYLKLIKIIYKGRSNWLAYFFGLVYIALPLACLVMMGIESNIHFQSVSNAATSYFVPLSALAIIFSIWINDTMAYIVGSFIGKTSLSPVSPKKTWEGTIGGAILCVVVISVVAASYTVTRNIGWYHWCIIALLCAVFGTLGDLFESKLKRMAGVKDSGQIMPGHGGFLDRFDSLLVATPAVWLYVKLFMPM